VYLFSCLYTIEPLTITNLKKWNRRHPRKLNITNKRSQINAAEDGSNKAMSVENKSDKGMNTEEEYSMNERNNSEDEDLIILDQPIIEKSMFNIYYIIFLSLIYCIIFLCLIYIEYK